MFHRVHEGSSQRGYRIQTQQGELAAKEIKFPPHSLYLMNSYAQMRESPSEDALMVWTPP